jgi:hypothetical protein
MLWRPVLREGSIFVLDIGSDMSGYSFTLIKSFNRSCSQPDIEPFVQKLIRYAVIVFLAGYFNVVIDVYPGFIPLCIFIKVSEVRAVQPGGPKYRTALYAIFSPGVKAGY